MKKTILILTSLLCMICISCQDESGDFIQQMFTDSELTSAARSCLTVSKDTAVSHLCDTDLLNTNETYRVTFPDNVDFRSLRQVLETQGQSQLLTLLETQMNAACELMGDNVTSTFNSAISSLTFSSPSELIYGSDNALTTYFQMKCESGLQSALASAMAAKMQLTGAASTWNDILMLYYSSQNAPFSFDLNQYVLQNFMNAIFAEMEKEEALIRHDASHQVVKKLKEVFGDN